MHTTVTPFAARKNGTATEAGSLAMAEPDVAVIVAVPFPTEVTRPVLDTVATVASDVAHVTVALAIVAPFWSLTVADSGDVLPSEARLRLVAERVIDVATGVGVGVGAVGVLSPPQLAKISENKLHAINIFMPLFCPALLRPATPDAQNSAGWSMRLDWHEHASSGCGDGGLGAKSRLLLQGTPKLDC